MREPRRDGGCACISWEAGLMWFGGGLGLFGGGLGCFNGPGRKWWLPFGHGPKQQRVKDSSFTASSVTTLT